MPKQKSFTNAIQRLVLTPANQLKPTVKRHVYWSKAAHALENSVDTFIAKQGAEPHVKSGIIKHGTLGKSSLNLRSTWARVNIKLEQKAIPGLEEFDNLEQYSASRLPQTENALA